MSIFDSNTHLYYVFVTLISLKNIYYEYFNQRKYQTVIFGALNVNRFRFIVYVEKVLEKNERDYKNTF